MVVPAPISTSFWIRTRTGLRHLDVLVPAEHEAKAVLAELAAGMNEYVVADQCELQRAASADIAVAADLDPGGDHRARADDGAGTDLHIRADHGQRIHRNVILELSRGMDDGGCGDASNVKAGDRTQRVRVQFARQFHEGRKWPLGAQHRYVSRNIALEALAHQAGTGLGVGELVDVAKIFEEGQVMGARLVERGYASHDLVGPRRVDQSCLR
jgi:hypothetical protein